MNITINIHNNEFGEGPDDDGDWGGEFTPTGPDARFEEEPSLPGPPGDDNELTMDDVEPEIGSVVWVADASGGWLALRTTTGWISHDRWVTTDYHKWFEDDASVYLMVATPAGGDE